MKNKQSAVQFSCSAMEDVGPLKISLFMLSLSGLNPRRESATSKVLRGGTSLIIAVIFPLILIKMLSDIENIDVLAPSFESMMTCYQVNQQNFF